MRRPLVTAVVGLALLAAACGDDDARPAPAAATDDGEDAADGAGAAEAAGGADEDPGHATPGDEGATTTTRDAVAAAPPAGAGDDEGMGDPFVYVADLRADEVPGGGDAGAGGRIEIRAADGQLCTDLEATGLASAATDAHVHEGAPGERGGVVVAVGPPTGGTGSVATWDDVCVPADPELARRLDTDAGLFHADVHTETHGDGAVRGQLGYATIFDLRLR